MFRSTIFLLLTLCVALFPAVLRAEETTPLRLTLTPDSPVLFATERPLLQATAETPRFAIEKGHLQLKIANTGKSPVRLNLYQLVMQHLALEVTGPSADAVRVERFAYFRTPLPVPMTARDIVTLAPGEEKVLLTAADFPGQFAWDIFTLLKPGAYRLRATYTNILPPAAKAEPLLAGSWQGAVASNEATLQVLEASPAVNGLQMALQVPGEPVNEKGPTALTGWFRNVSDKPLVIPAWDLEHQGLQVFGADGKPIAFTGGADASPLLSPAQRFSTLAPGGKRGYLIPVHYYSKPSQNPTPAGVLSVVDRSAFFREWNMNGNAVMLQGALTVGSTPGKEEERTANSWTGTVQSPCVRLLLDVTPHWVSLLNADPSTFILDLTPSVPSDKPFYSLSLHTPPIEQPIKRPFLELVPITPPQASAFIDFLANDGLLRTAYRPMPIDATQPPPAGYTLSITGGKGSAVNLAIDLGWDLAMLRHLDALRAALPEHAKPSMDLLLARLAGQRRQWEAEAAPRKRLTLTIDNLPLPAAVAQVNQAIATPDYAAAVPPTTPGVPSLTLQFINIPAQEIFTDLAMAADYAYNPRLNRFSALVR